MFIRHFFYEVTRFPLHNEVAWWKFSVLLPLEHTFLYHGSILVERYHFTFCVVKHFAIGFRCFNWGSQVKLINS